MSSWKSNLKKKYDEHRHCPICGISIPPDKEFCSLECRDKYQGAQKKQNRSQWIMMALMIGMVVVMTVIMPMFGNG
ncbi:MAG: DUF2116 family Zn-ribbon domain-containing protein [Candidatus Lokiarchaeota archaeon]|nr:DUF2116 family Zn-ribbon domain-containing protein [Candidatus Lokiarchaeota archaeon]